MTPPDARRVKARRPKTEDPGRDRPAGRCYPPRPMSRLDAIVVGAGVSGLTTAHELLAAGFAEADETIDCSGMVVMPGLIVS